MAFAQKGKLMAVIGDEDTVVGFLLGGIDIAIILINQHIAEMIRYQVDQHIASIPTVLEIPSKEMPYDASKDSILNRARGLINPDDLK
uniref:V-type proton ATPase subunit F n=1 Tax=Meloidogyne hapla TaxID=6305 RepID=A0A1I8BTL3_MELHA